jgi:cysteine synthase A
MNMTEPFARALDQAVLAQYPPLCEFLRGIGDTPLIEVPGTLAGARIYAKCEWENLTGTVKARTVFAMTYRELRNARRAGLRSPLRLIEYTGGSLGLALAGLCEQLGIRLTLVLSDATAPAVVSAIRDTGSEAVLVPRERGFWGVMEAAFELAQRNPEWRFLFQHLNPANPWVHRETTGREIVAQLPAGAIEGPCAWVASIGTGGTLMGVRSALARAVPHVQTFATTPAEAPYGTTAPPNGLPKFLGSGGLGDGRKQPLVVGDEANLTGHFHVTYPESLRGMVDFHARTGLRIGSSAAANWLAACRVAERIGGGGTVVTVFPSAATDFEWRKAEGASQPAIAAGGAR